MPGLHKWRIFNPSRSINRVHWETGRPQTFVASSINDNPSSHICKACYETRKVSSIFMSYKFDQLIIFVPREVIHPRRWTWAVPWRPFDPVLVSKEDDPLYEQNSNESVSYFSQELDRLTFVEMMPAAWKILLDDLGSLVFIKEFVDLILLSPV